jgi:hypothetical protein
VAFSSRMAECCLDSPQVRRPELDSRAGCRML